MCKGLLTLVELLQGALGLGLQLVLPLDHSERVSQLRPQGTYFLTLWSRIRRV